MRPKSIISDRFVDTLMEIGDLLLELSNVSCRRKLLRDKKAEFRPGKKKPFVKRTIVRHALKNRIVKKGRRIVNPEVARDALNRQGTSHLREPAVNASRISLTKKGGNGRSGLKLREFVTMERLGGADRRGLRNQRHARVT